MDIEKECHEIIDNYNFDREMAHIRSDCLLIDFIKSIKKNLESSNLNSEETIKNIDLIIKMASETEDSKWYA
jgi:hypothetical protein